MLRPQRMALMTVIYPKEYQDKLTYALLKTSCFQPTEPSVPLSQHSDVRARELTAKVSSLLGRVNSLIETYGLERGGMGTAVKEALKGPVVFKASSWSELLDDIERRLSVIEREISSMPEDKRAEAAWKRRTDIISLRDALNICGDAIEVLNNTRVTTFFAQAAGYVPKSKLGKVLKVIDEETGGRALVLVEDVEDAPTYLEYPTFLKPFLMVTSLYGVPNYKEVSPVLMLSLTFPLIFGLMFADTGHGLVLIVAGLIMYKLFARSESLRDLGLLVTYFGIAAAVAGIFSGEFFGPAPPLGTAYKSFVKKMLGVPEDQLLPLEIEFSGHGDVSAVVIWVLIFSIKLGIVHMLTGFALGIINKVIRREWLDLFTVTLPQTLVFALGSAPFLLAQVEGSSVKFPMLNYPGLNRMWLNAVIGLLLILALAKPIALKVLGRERVEGEEGGLMFSAFEAFDFLLRMVSNTASYMRILALLMAHIGLMFVFYQLALLSSSGLPGIAGNVVFALVYALGNLVTIGLEAIIVFAHTARLHFYEWFSKFYSGDGRVFTPVSVARGLAHVVISR